MDFSQFTAPCKKNVEPAARRIIKPNNEDSNVTRQRILEEQGRIVRTDPVADQSGDKGIPCRKVSWEAPNPEFLSDQDVPIPADELAVIIKEEKKRKPRKPRKNAKSPVQKVPEFTKSRRPPAKKIIVSCTTCPNKESVYPSQVVKAGDVGGFRCKRCLGG
jgi:hypothetical protein